MKYQNTLITIFLSLTLSACLPTDDPKTVADKYWQNLQNGNIQEAEKHVSHLNQQLVQQHSNHILTNSQLQNHQAKTIVSTTITTTNPTTSQVHTQTFDTVLVLKDGHWKVDLGETEIPPPPTTQEEQLEQLAEDLSESMQENMESLDEAIEQGMKVFNEALHDGSKEMGDSLIQMMNKLNKSMNESIDKMKQRREQHLREQEQQHNLQQTQPDPTKGEGRI